MSLLFALLLPLVALPQQVADEADFLPLFNGQDLDGWSDGGGLWTFDNGELVGRTTAAEPIPNSHYLFWEGEPFADFELRFSYRIDGGNSGIQYRSQRLGEWDVAGYQADIEDGPNYSGILYESAGRGILAPRGSRFRVLEDGSKSDDAPLGDAAALQAAVRVRDWNDYRVLAVGDHLIHEINGVRMIDVHDGSAKALRSGTLALQLHAGPPMEVRYRDVRIRRIAGEGAAVVEAEQPEWIWGPEEGRENEVRHFLHFFELQQSATVAGGAFAVDNAFQVWLDGRPLGQGDNWSQPSAIDVGMRLRAGSHGLALRATNEGGPAGVIGFVRLDLDDGSSRVLRTSPQWRSWTEDPGNWPRPSAASFEVAAPSRSIGTSARHSGPWGDVLRAPVATDPAAITIEDGYLVERIYSAQPGEGSWASMTFGIDGSLFVSPEAGRVLRFDLPEDLIGGGAVRVQSGGLPGVHAVGVRPPRELQFPVHSAQGMEWAYDALYVTVTAAPDADGGLHRLRDTDGDGSFDQHEHLARYGPRSEHGAHGIRLGPDGSLYTITGNYSKPPKGMDGGEVITEGPLRNFAEDVLLERIWDPRGHAHGILAPAAVLWRTDKDGRNWQRVSGGMRNPYDIAISAAGEIFTYDADMEWDHGAPWYRSPRVLHLVPGGAYGWRSGSAKWQETSPDTLPAIWDSELSSPVGVELGEGSAFAAAEQRALFLGDWAWGRILVVPLEADGASYTAQGRTFLEGRGLTVTDLEFGPDGNLWFVTGGRGTQSGLFRVRPLQRVRPLLLPPPPSMAERRRLEGARTTWAQAWPYLAHTDRFLRTAARQVLERTPADEWMQALMGEEAALPALEAALALARVGAAQHADELGMLLQHHRFADLDPIARHLHLRTAMLWWMRGEGSAQEHRASLVQTYQPAFPSGDAALDRELAKMLTALEAPGLPATFLAKMVPSVSQEEQMHYGMLLRLVHQGWTPEQRLQYFTWLWQAESFQGGLSLKGFLEAMRKDSLAGMDAEAQAVLEVGIQALPVATAVPVPAVARPLVRAWTTDEALAASQSASGRVTEGASLFQQALCIQCHRFAGQGGALGPDLTAVARRFSARDLLEAAVEPQKVVSDQYKGLIMPPGLLNSFSEQDLADLLAFLEAGQWPQ